MNTISSFIRSQHIFGDTDLSNREIEVAELVVKGRSNKEVATELFVTEKTVKFHLTNVYKKLKVKSRGQLIVAALPYMQAKAKADAQRAEAEANKAEMAKLTEIIPLHPRLPEGNA